MKKFIVFIVIILLCLGPTVFGQVTFTGTVINSPEQKVFLVDLYNRKVDSAIINKNKSTFSLRSDIKEESFFNMFYMKKGPFVLNQFVVLPGEHVRFFYDVSNSDKELWIKVSGSKNSIERITALKEMYGYKLKKSELNKQISSIIKGNYKDTSVLSLKKKEVDQNEEKANKVALTVLDTTKSSFNGSQMLSVLRSSELLTDEEKRQLILKLQSKFPDNKSIQALTGTSEDMAEQGLAVNSIIPEIQLTDTHDVITDISKYNFKYMLVDFWASWCKPCREESPNLVKAMQDFELNGFKILSVSFDTKTDVWLKAIKHDNTQGFYHVIDTNGLKSKYLNEFRIISLPANFLIDSKGKIIAKNLRGEELEKKLHELLR